MAFENVRNTVPAVFAAADLSTHQFKAVKVTAPTQVNLATVLGERVLGVLQNKPTTGVAATVAVPGSTTKMVASAAITAGAFVTTTAAGLAVTALTGNNILGVALDTVTAASQLVTVQLETLGNAP